MDGDLLQAISPKRSVRNRKLIPVMGTEENLQQAVVFSLTPGLPSLGI